MTIGDVARRTGVRQSAIRYYESIGLMPRPARASGRRVYDGSAVNRLLVIRSARDAGFGVREVLTLMADSGSTTSITARWRALAQRKLPEINALIDRATRMKRLLESGLQCGCMRIEDCILYDCAPPTVRGATLKRGSRLLSVRSHAD